MIHSGDNLGAKIARQQEPQQTALKMTIEFSEASSDDEDALSSWSPTPKAGLARGRAPKKAAASTSAGKKPAAAAAGKATIHKTVAAKKVVSKRLKPAPVIDESSDDDSDADGSDSELKAALQKMAEQVVRAITRCVRTRHRRAGRCGGWDGDRVGCGCRASFPWTRRVPCEARVPCGARVLAIAPHALWPSRIITNTGSEEQAQGGGVQAPARGGVRGGGEGDSRRGGGHYPEGERSSATELDNASRKQPTRVPPFFSIKYGRRGADPNLGSTTRAAR